MNDFPLLGFPEENNAGDIGKYRYVPLESVLYSCRPTPETAAFVEKSGTRPECYWVGVYELRHDDRHKALVAHTLVADCPLQVLGFIHNFVTTHGGAK